jgi:hypothetical protein
VDSKLIHAKTNLFYESKIVLDVKQADINIILVNFALLVKYSDTVNSHNTLSVINNDEDRSPVKDFHLLSPKRKWTEEFVCIVGCNSAVMKCVFGFRTFSRGSSFFTKFLQSMFRKGKLGQTLFSKDNQGIFDMDRYLTDNTCNER